MLKVQFGLRKYINIRGENVPDFLKNWVGAIEDHLQLECLLLDN